MLTAPVADKIALFLHGWMVMLEWMVLSKKEVTKLVEQNQFVLMVDVGLMK